MRLVDLTLPVPESEHGHPTVTPDEWPIIGPDFQYTGMVYHFTHRSMSGTYIDFPGHIKELDDGVAADNCPIEKLYELPSAVVHLNRADKPGKISADELRAACPHVIQNGGLVIHALGEKRFDEIPERSVALAKNAVGWIVDNGISLLVSDVYEHATEPDNVFWDLFSGGVSTVCSPINMGELTTPMVKLTVLFPRFSGVTQLACRIIAGIEV